MFKYNCCVNISPTKNAAEHVHLEVEFFQNQLLIADRLTRFPSPTFPQRHSAFACWSSASINFNGAEWRSGLAWTLGFCVMIRGSAKDWVAIWLTAILKHKMSPELYLVLSPIADFASDLKDNCNLFLDSCLAKWTIFIVHFIHLYTQFLVSV